MIAIVLKANFSLMLNVWKILVNDTVFFRCFMKYILLHEMKHVTIIMFDKV